MLAPSNEKTEPIRVGVECVPRHDIEGPWIHLQRPFYQTTGWSQFILARVNGLHIQHQREILADQPKCAFLLCHQDSSVGQERH